MVRFITELPNQEKTARQQGIKKRTTGSLPVTQKLSPWESCCLGYSLCMKQEIKAKSKLVHAGQAVRRTYNGQLARYSKSMHRESFGLGRSLYLKQ